MTVGQGRDQGPIVDRKKDPSGDGSFKLDRAPVSEWRWIEPDQSRGPSMRMVGARARWIEPDQSRIVAGALRKPVKLSWLAGERLGHWPGW